MSFVAASVQQQVRGMQEGGFRLIQFCARFSTTDASGDVDCMLGTIYGYTIHSIGPLATDEQLYLDELSSWGDGTLRRPADGRLTFTRTGAAKTSGLWVVGSYWGY